jgi:hypothetical protein
MSAPCEQIDIHAGEGHVVDFHEPAVEVELDLGFCEAFVCVHPIEDDPEATARARDL